MLSPNGKFLAINNVNRQYRMINIDDGSSTSEAPEIAHGDPVFSQDGKRVAIVQSRAGADEFHFWELNTKNELTQWQGLAPGDGDYYNYSLNSNFTRLATFATDGYSKHAYLWKIPEFSLVHVLTQSSKYVDRHINSPIESLRFISDDRLLFAVAVSQMRFFFGVLKQANCCKQYPQKFMRARWAIRLFSAQMDVCF